MADAWLFTDEIDQFHANLTINREKPAHALCDPILGPTRLTPTGKKADDIRVWSVRGDVGKSINRYDWDFQLCTPGIWCERSRARSVT
jgi:hypothetical protein